MDLVYVRDLRVDTVIGIYDWEREIRQVVSIDLEMATDIAKAASSDSIEDTLDYNSLPYEITNFNPEFDVNNYNNNDFNTQVDLYKKKLIKRALNECNWIQKKAASSLGLKPTTLSELMKRLEITK